MYVCLDCGRAFEDPKHYVETHGLNSSPYEEWDGCPKCGGNYVEAILCYECGEWITGEYVELKNGDVIGECCYEIKDIGDSY